MYNEVSEYSLVYWSTTTTAAVTTNFVILNVFLLHFVARVWKHFLPSVDSRASSWQMSEFQRLSKDVCSVTRLADLFDFGTLLKHLATIILPKYPTFLGNFCKGVKMSHFSSEIIFGQLLWTLGNFYGHWATFMDIWRLFSCHTGCLRLHNSFPISEGGKINKINQ